MPATDPSAAMDAYLDHLRVERRLAHLTLESYSRDLAALFALQGARHESRSAGRPALAHQLVHELDQVVGQPDGYLPAHTNMVAVWDAN